MEVDRRGNSTGQGRGRGGSVVGRGWAVEQPELGVGHPVVLVERLGRGSGLGSTGVDRATAGSGGAGGGVPQPGQARGGGGSGRRWSDLVEEEEAGLARSKPNGHSSVGDGTPPRPELSVPLMAIAQSSPMGVDPGSDSAGLAYRRRKDLRRGREAEGKEGESGVFSGRRPRPHRPG